MAKRNIGKEIIQGLEEIKAWKQGKARLRSYTVDMPRAADVSAIRKELGLSQDQFALFMGVSVATQPQAVRAAFKSVMPAPRTKAYAKAT